MNPSHCRYATALFAAALYSPVFAQSPKTMTLYGAFPTVGLVQSEFGNGVQELRFRELVLSETQVERLMDPDFLRDLAGSLSLPGGGGSVEIQVQTVQGRSFSLAVDRRGELLRARITGARFTSKRDGKRLLKRLRSIFSALEIRGTDGEDHEFKLAAHKRGVDGSDLPAEPVAEPEPASEADSASERGDSVPVAPVETANR